MKKKKNRSILHVFLALCMMCSLLGDIRFIYADESPSPTLNPVQSAPANPTLSVSYQNRQERGKPLEISVKIGEENQSEEELTDLSDFESNKEIEPGKKIVISIGNITKGRRAYWIVKSLNRDVDYEGAIFKKGDSGNSLTISQINSSQEPTDKISFLMPSESLIIEVTEVNHIIDFLDSSLSSEPGPFVNSKAGILLSTLNPFAHRRHESNWQKLNENDISWKILQSDAAVIEEGRVKPLVLGKSGETTRIHLAATDNEGNVGIWYIELRYSLKHQVKIENASIQIYDHKGNPHTPDSAGVLGSKTYNVVEEDRVSITAEKQPGKAFVKWIVTENSDPNVNQVLDSLKVLSEEGKPTESLVKDYDRDTISFLMPTIDTYVLVLSFVPEYTDAYRISFSPEARVLVDAEIKPAQELTEGMNVSIKLSPKDPKKVVRTVIFSAQVENLEVSPDKSTYRFKMPAQNLIISSVELEDKKEAPAPPPSSGNSGKSNSGSETSSDSDSSVGAGSKSSSVRRITPKDNAKKVSDKKDGNTEQKEQASKENSESTSEQRIQSMFQDVTSNDWFAASVAFVEQNNLMRGTAKNEFSPNQNTSRAMLVTILHRLVGTPSVDAHSNFIDVKGDEYYAKAIDWAIKNNIVKGYEDGSFKANNDVTREQVAVILYNYAKTADLDLTAQADLSKFEDMDAISSYAADALKWANAQGIILGKGRALDPKGKATRAEIAAIMMRFHTKLK